MKNKILVLMLALILCLTGTINTFAVDNNALAVEMNGKAFEMPARVWDGELYLPLRAVTEALGFAVQWDGDKKEIQVTKPEKSINLNLPEYKINVNGHESYMTSGYRLVDGRTYLRQDFFTDNIGLDVTLDKVNDKATLQSVQENHNIIITRKEFLETDTLKLTIQYPELSGLENAEVQDKLNALFSRLASEAKGRGHEIGKYIGQDEITRHIKAEGYFNYQVKYNRKGLLSIVFYDYQYSGGAHGGTVQSSYTFDLNTGKEFELKDLFTDGSDYVSSISSEVKRQLEERGMTVLLAPFDTIRADHDFYISGNSIVVYFQQYEILPYAYGIPEFSVDRPLIQQ